MLKVFYSQKTEQLFKKLELTQWRKYLQEKINQHRQDLSDNWKMCALGEIMRVEGRELKNIKELTPETRLLGDDFSVAIQNGDNDTAIEIIEKIERTKTIWRD